MSASNHTELIEKKTASTLQLALTGASVAIVTVHASLALWLLGKTLPRDLPLADTAHSVVLLIAFFSVKSTLMGKVSGGRGLSLALLSLNLALSIQHYPELFALERFGEFAGVVYALIMVITVLITIVPADLLTKLSEDEQEFDFKHWVKASVVRFAIAFVLDSIAFLAILEIFSTAVTWWWLPVSAIFSLQLLIVSVMEPKISIWSEKLVPLDAPDHLRALIEKSELKNVQVVLDHKGSNTNSGPNGWVLSLAGQTLVCLKSRLFRQEQQNIQFVLSHELGHAKSRHQLKLMVVNFALNSTSLGLFAQIWQVITADGVISFSPFTQLSLTLFILFTSRQLFKCIENWFSRRFEREADSYAVTLMETPAGMLSYFNPAAKAHATGLFASEGAPSTMAAIRWFESSISFLLGDTHPPCVERFETATRLQASLQASRA